MQNKLIALIGKEIILETGNDWENKFWFRLDGILEESFNANDHSSFYLRIKQDATGTSGIQFCVDQVEGIEKGIYCHRVFLK